MVHLRLWHLAAVSDRAVYLALLALLVLGGGENAKRGWQSTHAKKRSGTAAAGSAAGG